MASCSPIIDTRGHNEEELDLSQVVKGQTSAADVAALLGSPTSTSSFGATTWYYITAKQERVGIFAPEITQQRVRAIQFDDTGVVSDIRDYELKDGKQVELVEKVTPTEGHDLTMMEQMLGNLGRFNAPSRGADPRRSPGR